MQILSLSLPKCNTCMVARRSDLYGRLPKAPFFLRQSASPSLAPAFTTHNRDEVATPFVYIRGKILPTASAISLKLAKRLTRSALQASARTRHNRPYPNHLRSRSQLTTHYSQLRRSRPIRVIRGLFIFYLCPRSRRRRRPWR